MWILQGFRPDTDLTKGGVRVILEQTASPDDVKALPKQQLPILCQELREFLIQSVSRTGGHLASNLGVVELTVAIHRVFDTSRDRLVFDVGHQCYIHKALTGRRELFSTLRQFQGLAGFPKPAESVHDAFIAGHASNSVSAALGMARARTLLGETYSVLSLIGDGALTGGLSYEGMNDAGASGEPLIVILNDNGMSISPNVGGLTKHLNRLRSRPAYYHFKKWYRRLFGADPPRNPIYRFNHGVKSAVKKLLLPGSTLFEDMGFTYLGPIDGHDIFRLCDVLQWAKELRRPVLVHVKTKKGKGCRFAEENPDRFHGVGPFDVKTGRFLGAEQETFSQIFGETLVRLAVDDGRICAVTAAMKDGAGLSGFAEVFPERFFDVGIAEGHGAAMSAGLAAQGMIPVFAVYSTFLQRAVDMLIHDVALSKTHVVFGVDRAGLVGADGETHQGCFDAVFLPEIPGFRVLCPANFQELRSMLEQALFHIPGPVAVRYPRGGEGVFREDTSGKSLACLRRGGDAVLVSYGILINHALEAAERLSLRGIQAAVWKLNRIAPLDETEVCAAFGGKERLLVLEDCVSAGCVGERIGAILAARRQPPGELILKNLGDRFAPAGRIAQLERYFGLDATGVVDAVLRSYRASGGDSAGGSGKSAGLSGERRAE